MGTTGLLLVVVTVVWFLVGDEGIEAAYQYVKAHLWLLLCFLAGVVLSVGGIVLSSVTQPRAAAPGTVPAPETASPETACCRHCQAPNDFSAKFCNQCGTAI